MGPIQSVNEDQQHTNSIKVSSASIQIIRPNTLAKRRLVRRRDNQSTENKSNQAQVIVAQFIDK